MVKERKHKKAAKITHKNKVNKVKSLFKGTFKWFILYIFIIISLLPLGFFLYYQDKIYPNINIANINAGNKTKDQMRDLINQKFSNFNGTSFKFTSVDKEWDFSVDTLGMSLNIEQTIENAYRTGRELSLISNLKVLFNPKRKTISIPLVINYDELKFTNSMSKITDLIDKPLIEPAIYLKDNKIVLEQGSEGKKLDKEKLKQKINTSLENNLHIVELPIETLPLSITKEQTDLSLKRAEKILTKKLDLNINQEKYSLDNSEIVSLIAIKGGFDVDKIASLTANLANSYNKESQNAMFVFENGRVTTFKPALKGYKINQNETIPIINDSLNKLEATESAILETNIPLDEINPEITTDKVNDLGIKELIGRGFSTFRGSIASRIHNIKLASSKLNGVLIKPGQIFSFNDAVGDISSSTGFQQAYIIQNGRTILGDGGGVCQVSTTLFRAALNTGLPITERQAHAYRVAYYEQGFGPGLDATVFAPSVDLKFENDTSSYILIQTIFDPQNLSLAFELYGTSDGRKAYISIPKVWDQTPPPPPKYEDDPTLPQGQEKQVDFEAWGARTSFEYKVTRNDEVLINKTFYSNFKPWQAVYLRGTKT